jgi:hypothetical protein
LLASCADPFIESTTLLGDTPDTIGPYTVQSVVFGINEDDIVEVFYNAVDNSPERYIPIRMEGLDDDGRSAELFEGAIPGQDAGATIRYFVAVDRQGERVAEDPVGGDLRPFMLRISP